MSSNVTNTELIETLKFTPCTYRVEITGYGGEVYFGKIDRKIYDFFKEEKIDIEAYAGSWDEENWEFVPDDMRPFPPGSPYECDYGAHMSGATFDDNSYITVYDENNKEIWSSALGPSLNDAGVDTDCIEERYIGDLYELGTPVFWGGQGEKGLFFSSEFELRQPFDPKKLRVLYEDIDGWELTSGVEYDGDSLDSYDYDTTGKWGENKWIFVGGNEEVYEGKERNNEDDE